MPALRKAGNSRSLTAVRKKRDRVRDDDLQREGQNKDGGLKPAATKDCGDEIVHVVPGCVSLHRAQPTSAGRHAVPLRENSKAVVSTRVRG
jgi:hypothetical protein